MHKKVHNEQQRRWQQRRRRVMRKVEKSDRPALTVFRSAKHMYAQIVDGESGKTLVTVSTRQSAIASGLAGTGNVEAAKAVGRAIAEAARAQDVSRVVFNRNGFLYHGRVKALAEAAREAGLEF